MRIVHAVTLVDELGSYGGPLRVAVDQAREQQRRGHSPILLGGWRGRRPAPNTYHGVPAALASTATVVPGTGFAGLLPPALFSTAAPLLATADVVHVHLGRELTVATIAGLALRAKVPMLVQTHGMIIHSDHRLAPMVDRLAIRRQLRGAAAVVALSAAEVADLRRVEPCLPFVSVLGNGYAGRTSTPTRPRPPGPPDVLFLARLSARKRPVAFVRAAQALAQHHPAATFSLVGPDEGELASVRRELQRDNADGRIRYEGPLPGHLTQARMERADLYVLPAPGETFGMTVLEALAAGTAPIVLEDCGLAPVVRQLGGEVVTSSMSSLAAAIDSLLKDPERRTRLRREGPEWVRRHAGITTIVDQLDTIYSRVIA